MLSLPNYLLAQSHAWITFSTQTVTDTGFPISWDALLWWTCAIIVMENGNWSNWIIQNRLQNVLREMWCFTFISFKQHDSLRALLVSHLNSSGLLTTCLRKLDVDNDIRNISISLKKIIHKNYNKISFVKFFFFFYCSSGQQIPQHGLLVSRILTGTVFCLVSMTTDF